MIRGPSAESSRRGMSTGPQFPNAPNHNLPDAVPPSCRGVGVVKSRPTAFGGARPALRREPTMPSLERQVQTPACLLRGQSADSPRDDIRAGRGSHATDFKRVELCVSDAPVPGGWLLVVRFQPIFSTRNRRRPRHSWDAPLRASDGPAGLVLTPLAGSGGLGRSWAPFPLLPLTPIVNGIESWCFWAPFMSEERHPPEDHRRHGLASGGWAGESRGIDDSGSAAGLVAAAPKDQDGHGSREWQGAN